MATSSRLTPNQQKVLDAVPSNYSQVPDINRKLGRAYYEASGTQATLDSLKKRGLVLKSGKAYRKATRAERRLPPAKVTAETPKVSPPTKDEMRAISSAVVSSLDDRQAQPPSFLRSATEYWVDPSDLVISDANGVFNDGKIFRSGEDEVTVRYDKGIEDEYFTLKLGDTIAALQALRDKPVARRS